MLFLLALSATTAEAASRALVRPVRPASASAPAATSSSTKAGDDSALTQLKQAQEVEDLFRTGHYSRAKALLAGQLRKDSRNGVLWYNLACAQSRLGELDNALASLERAIAAGFGSFAHMDHDEDLSAVRQAKGYADLLKRRDTLVRLRAEKMLAALKKQYGDQYICEVEESCKLVLATNIDRHSLDALKDRLQEQAEALWNDLFHFHFEQYVTVVISKTDPQKMSGVGGYYDHARRILTAKTVGMTVTHEFTHALHLADQDGLGQRHPIWIAEGLATLFESSEVEDEHITPRPNHRLNYLQALASRGKTLPWREFFTLTGEKFMQQSTIAYPQGRYIMMYLFEKGKLRKWYTQYVSDYENDPTGARAMEAVFEKKLPEVEADWLAWLRQLKAPPYSLPPSHAVIGVAVQQQTDGIGISRVLPDSGAAKAGLQAGDTIYRIDGRDVLDGDDLVMLVDGHEAGDSLEIEYRRQGQTGKVSVVLSAVSNSAAQGQQKAPSRQVLPRSNRGKVPASAPVRRRAA